MLHPSFVYTLKLILNFLRLLVIYRPCSVHRLHRNVRRIRGKHHEILSDRLNSAIFEIYPKFLNNNKMIIRWLGAVFSNLFFHNFPKYGEEVHVKSKYFFPPVRQNQPFLAL